MEQSGVDPELDLVFPLGVLLGFINREGRVQLPLVCNLPIVGCPAQQGIEEFLRTRKASCLRACGAPAAVQSSTADCKTMSIMSR